MQRLPTVFKDAHMDSMAQTIMLAPSRAGT